ncbi:MAG: EamA family transporter [Flavobacterium sp.]|nr:MAG: EamA family transporter [Flavobacterium sp.]
MKKLHKNNSLLGFLFALLATAIWSGNFIVARDLSSEIPPISLAFWRWTVAVIVFTPFAIISFRKNWKELIKNYQYILITSFFGVTVFNTLIYIAGKTTTALNLSLISITFPVFIIIFSQFLYKEKITLRKIIGITLVLTGVITIITKGSLDALFELSFHQGDIWMLLAAIIFAIYSILLKRKPKELNLIPFQYASFVVGLVMLVPFYLYEVFTTKTILYSSNAIGSIIYIGVCASLLAFLLWNKAILLIGPTKSGMVYYTLPLFSGLLAYFILNESLSFFHLYSTVLIISGIAISTINKK